MRGWISCRYSSTMSASRLGECRESGPMATPAWRAIALRDALLEAAKAERAAVRMRSRLVRASFLDGVWCAGGVMAGPFGVIGRELAGAESQGRSLQSGGVSGTLAS